MPFYWSNMTYNKMIDAIIILDQILFLASRLKGELKQVSRACSLFSYNPTAGTLIFCLAILST